MPFSEFRFLNGSNNPGDSTVVVGATPPQSIPQVAPKHEQAQPVPPAPAPANAINMADVVLHGGQSFVLNGPVPSPDGTDFEMVGTVVLEGGSKSTVCMLIGRTMGGAQVCVELT